VFWGNLSEQNNYDNCVLPEFFQFFQFFYYHLWFVFFCSTDETIMFDKLKLL
jgi:hypothetical protein